MRLSEIDLHVIESSLVIEAMLVGADADTSPKRCDDVTAIKLTAEGLLPAAVFRRGNEKRCKIKAVEGLRWTVRDAREACECW